MVTRTDPSQRKLDATLGALSDPTRRRILERLSHGDARVTELAKRFPISLNSVSKHIRVLERAGLVRRRVVGRDHILSFRSAPLDSAAAWIESRRALWKRRLVALDELLRAEDEQAMSGSRPGRHAERAKRKGRSRWK